VVHSRPSRVNDPIRILELSGLTLSALDDENRGRAVARVLAFVSLLFNCAFVTAVGVYALWVPLPSRTEVEYEEQSSAERSALKDCSQPCVKV
jgi:hypothetical protein